MTSESPLPTGFRTATVPTMPTPLLAYVGLEIRDPDEDGPRLRWELDGGGSLLVDYAGDVSWIGFPSEGPPFLPARYSVVLGLPDVTCGIRAEVDVSSGEPVLATIAALRHRRLAWGQFDSRRQVQGQQQYREQSTEVELTTVVLRQVSPPTVLRYAVAAALHPAPGGVPEWPAVTWSDLDAATVAAHGTQRRRRRLDDDLLREVAEVYSSPPPMLSPVEAVRRHWHPLPESTAHRWINAARAAKHLAQRNTKPRSGP